MSPGVEGGGFTSTVGIFPSVTPPVEGPVGGLGVAVVAVRSSMAAPFCSLVGLLLHAASIAVMAKPTITLYMIRLLLLIVSARSNSLTDNRAPSWFPNIARVDGETLLHFS